MMSKQGAEVDTRKRTLAKALTYRLLAAAITAAIGYGILSLDVGEAVIAGATAIALADGLVKVAFYYLHERCWNRARWGKSRGGVVWFYGLPCSGKTTIAKRLEAMLTEKGIPVARLDGDVLRSQGGLCSDLGFSAEDRHENLRRTCEAARLLRARGAIVLAANLTPREGDRAMIREAIPDVMFTLVDAPSELCESRDVKGMWALARRGEIKLFTGVSDVFEKGNPELLIPMTADDGDIANSALRVLEAIKERRWI